MSVPLKTNVSFVTLAAPDACRCAPLAATELAQPLPAAPEFPHGHAVPDPSPEQYTVAGVATTKVAHTMSNACDWIAGTCVVVVPSVTANATLYGVSPSVFATTSGKSSTVESSLTSIALRSG